MPNGKLKVVGYTDEQEVVSEQTLGSQRAVNVKYYLTTDKPTKSDPIDTTSSHCYFNAHSWG